MTSPETSQNILITGLPRSGTTMTCHLLNKLPDSVALNEPMPVSRLAALEPEDLVSAVHAFFVAQRTMISHEGKARSKSSQGTVPANHITDPDATGQRKSLLDGTEIIVRNVTGADFNVYIKHPAFFTAALPVLVKSFGCFAIMRNPLSVLLSWRTSGMAHGEGRMPAAERVDHALAAALDAAPDTLERQLILIDFCFGRYAACLPGRTVKYEDVIASRGKALSRIAPAASLLDEPLESRNALGLKSDPAVTEIARRLLDRASPCWTFYARADVEGMLR